MNDNTPHGKILSMVKDASFYLRRAQTYSEKGEYEEALGLLWSGHRLEPKNPEIWIELSWIYARLRYFEFSNEWLFLLMQDKSVDFPECLFALGTNFYCMEEYDLAQRFLEEYLTLYPDGDSVEDAEYALSVLDDVFDAAEAESVDPIFKASLKKKYHEVLTKGWMTPEAEEYAPSESEVDELTREEAIHVFIELCRIRFDHARTDANRVAWAEELYRYYPRDVMVLSYVSVLRYDMSGEVDRGLLEDLIKAMNTSGEDRDRFEAGLAHFLCREYDKACEILEPLLRSEAYPACKVEDLLATSLCCAGKTEEGIRIWERRLALVPEDDRADFFARQARSPEGQDYIESDDPVPRSGIMSAIAEFAEYALSGVGDPSEIWNDPEKKNLMLRLVRGLPYDSDQSKLLFILNAIAGEDVAPYLRRMLILPHIDKEMREQIAKLLLIHGEEPPFLTYIDGQIIEIHARLDNIRLNSIQKKVLDGTLTAMGGRYTGHENAVADLWFDTVRRKSGPGNATRRAEPWMAALEIAYCRANSLPYDEEKIRALYGADPAAVSKCLTRIEKEKPDDPSDR